VSDDPQRVDGVVVWFAEERGWGVVEDDSGRRAYVDYTQIVGNGLRTLAQGQPVTFTLARGPRGPVAERVERDGERETSGRRPGAGGPA